MEANEDGKERKMKGMSKSIIQNRASGVLALLALLVAISPSAGAKPKPVKPAAEPAAVIAHLALPGAPASQLVLQERGNKQYLYIEQASKEGFAIVDVTKASEPNVIRREAWPNAASSGRLQPVGYGLALAEASDAGTEPISRTRTLKVLDLSDPTNPRTILSFSGVTSTLADDARNLVYITNSDGLWIVRNNQALMAAAKRDACTSDDAYNEVASCQ
jgi:hypothetical protein